MPTAPRSTDGPPRSELWRSRYWMPGFCLALGLLMLAAFAIGDEPAQGLQALAVMAAIGVVLLIGGRSETLRGLGGPGRDERWSMIDVKATAFTGAVVVCVVLGAWLVEVARGMDGKPYSAIGAVGGLAYIGAVAVLRWRS